VASEKPRKALWYAAPRTGRDPARRRWAAPRPRRGPGAGAARRAQPGDRAADFFPAASQRGEIRAHAGAAPHGAAPTRFPVKYGLCDRRPGGARARGAEDPRPSSRSIPHQKRLPRCRPTPSSPIPDGVPPAGARCSPAKHGDRPQPRYGTPRPGPGRPAYRLWSGPGWWGALTGWLCGAAARRTGDAHRYRSLGARRSPPHPSASAFSTPDGRAARFAILVVHARRERGPGFATPAIGPPPASRRTVAGNELVRRRRGRGPRSAARFHSRRLRLVASQVGQVAAPRIGRAWTHRRRASPPRSTSWRIRGSMRLLGARPSRFHDLPARLFRYSQPRERRIVPADRLSGGHSPSIWSHFASAKTAIPS